jgi:hypothetical protein
MGVALAFLPYGLFLLGGGATPASLRAVLGLALLAGLPLVFAPPILSDDVYRYLWDGHVTLSGVDPYRYAPDDPALAWLRDAAWSRVNHPRIPTIYPPVAQLLFALAAALGHAKAVIAALALAAHLGVTVLVARLAPAHKLRAASLYALNPLALTESALTAHVDVFVGLFLVASVLSLGRRRHLWAGLWAGLASGVKLVGIAFLPLFGRRRARGMLLAGLLGAAALLPLLGAGRGSGVTGGLGQYARHWQGNGGPYAVLEAGLTQALNAAGRAQDAPEGHVHLTVLRPLLTAVSGSVLDPRAALVAEKKQTPDVTDFLASTLAGLLLRSLVVSFVFVLGAVLTHRGVPPLRAARVVLLVGLLLAPQVHPWYLLWLLPLEVASGGVTGLVWSATVLVAYAPLDAWQASRHWVEQPLLIVVEYLLVFFALGLDFAPRLDRFRRARRRTRPAPHGVKGLGRVKRWVSRGNAAQGSLVSGGEAEPLERPTSTRVDPSTART